jgi:hypothetical protein
LGGIGCVEVKEEVVLVVQVLGELEVRCWTGNWKKNYGSDIDKKEKVERGSPTADHSVGLSILPRQTQLVSSLVPAYPTQHHDEKQFASLHVQILQSLIHYI